LINKKKLLITLFFNTHSGCIELGFEGILKDFLMIKKYCGIESRFLWSLNKSCGILIKTIKIFF
jgi:hypothetical protein